jgi:uncharacterized protein (TIGR02145 family)
MARNLNYEPATGNSWCYENYTSNCGKYGRLYDWATASVVCPSNWHLPTDNDWDTLVNNVGGSSTAGKHLKSTSGWSDNGNGLDTYGFSALSGGRRTNNGFYYYESMSGDWWSADENHRWYISYDTDYFGFVGLGGDYGLSVRCVQDNAP